MSSLPICTLPQTNTGTSTYLDARPLLGDPVQRRVQCSQHILFHLTGCHDKGRCDACLGATEPNYTGPSCSKTTAHTCSSVKLALAIRMVRVLPPPQYRYVAPRARSTWAPQFFPVSFTGIGCFFFLKNDLPVMGGVGTTVRHHEAHAKSLVPKMQSLPQIVSIQ